VHVQIIQADAGTRCVGINAAALALAHAGIPMKDMVAAISVGKINGKVYVDLNKDEELYPLEIMHCSKCNLCQLSYVVPPEKMFKNYLYVTSTTDYFKKHFGEY